MMRATLATLVCTCAFAAGMLTVLVAARNRARGAQLDAQQRWCEIFSRQNESYRADVRAREWRLHAGVEENDEPRSEVQR